MKQMIWLSRMFVQKLSPQQLVDLAMDIWPHVWVRVPTEQRVTFLKNILEQHTGSVLGGLNREDRIALMNGLLPLAAREFPLSELDFLTVFASPGDRYHPQDIEA